MNGARILRMRHLGKSTRSSTTLFFLYHLRGALWQAIVNRLTGFSDGELEAYIVSHLGTGDSTLTNHLLTSRRALMV